MKKNKYNATKTEVDGIVFASKKEAERYKELKECKNVEDLQCQKKFLLQKGFKHEVYGGIRPIYYIADFFYYNNVAELYIVEDVKGKRTDVYKLKRKLFLAKYGDMYIFSEV